jgi:hypothetical protein
MKEQPMINLVSGSSWMGMAISPSIHADTPEEGFDGDEQ